MENISDRSIVNKVALFAFERLGRFEQRLLIAIDQLKADAYCKALAEHLKVTEGQTSRSLSALKGMGILEVRRAAPVPVRGGRSRLVYSLSPTGKHLLGDKGSQSTVQTAGASLLAV